MPFMHTDEAAMAAQAARLQDIGAQLKTLLASAEATVEGVQPQFVGQSGMAFQAAHARYQQAQLPLITQINTIGQNVQGGGVQYNSGDSDGASMVSSGFNI